MPDNQTLTLPDLSQHVPDLTPFRYNIGDDNEYIEKANNAQAYLENFFTDYNASLTQYGQVILAYLEAAQDVPISIRNQFTQLVQDAQAAAAQAAAVLSGINLPAVTIDGKGKVLVVNPHGTGYELVDYTSLNSDGSAYTHPSSHPASMILEDETKRFVSDALITAWNKKANETHSHAASDIKQDEQHQFVTLDEKEKLNSRSGVRIEKHFDSGYLGQGVLNYGTTSQYSFLSDRVKFNSLTDTSTVFVTLSLGVFTDETSLTDDYKYDAPRVNVWFKGYNHITEGNGVVLMEIVSFSHLEGVKGKYWQQFFKRLPLSTLGDYEYFGISVFASSCHVPFSVNGADLIFEEYC